MSPRPSCPVCQASISPGAPGGLCTRCAFAQMLGAGPLGPPQASHAFPRPFGDYELLGEIARGGMGVVYRARQVSLDRVVALKVILSSHLASPDFVGRFRIEARSAASLDHPHIVPIYEIGEHADEPFFSMKLVEGETLSARIARDWRRNGEKPTALQIQSYVRIVAALARAVHYAHQRGILHRDIKPNNVLLGLGDAPFLTDFGLAKLLEGESGVTRTAALLGTPSYMSPEQARGDRTLTTAADTYGLGALLYESLTGRPPFAADTSIGTIRSVIEEDPVSPRVRNPALEPELETICLKCLEKEPGARYSSAEALADDLERWSRHETILARPATPSERFRKWVRRRPAVASAAGVVILAITTVAIVSTVSAFRLNKARQVTEQINARLEEHVRDLEWQKAEELAETDKVGEALAYFARLVRNSPDPSVPAARIISMLGLRAFALPAGEPVRHRRGVTALDFSPSGEWLAAASLDHSVSLSNPGGPARFTLEHSSSVLAVKFHPGGRALMTVCRNGDAPLWDIHTRSIVRQFRAADLNDPLLDFSRDGRWLALRTSINGFTVFDTNTGEAVFGPVEGDDGLRLLRFFPAESEDDVLVTTAWNGAIHLYELPSGRILEPRLRLQNPAAFALITPDRRHLISTELGKITVWDRRTGILQREMITGRYEVIHLVVSPDSRRLLSLSYLEPPRLWNVHTGEPLSEPLGLAANAVDGTFSPDGAAVVVAAGGAAFVFDGHTGKRLLEPIQLGGSIRRARFSRDGQLVTTASEDGLAQSWDVRMRESQRMELAGIKELREAVLSRDGRTLITSNGHDLHRRDVSTGRVIGAPMSHSKPIFRAAISPDGRRLACIAYDFAAHLWDITTGQEATPPLVHQDQLTRAEFSPDGRWVVTTSTDRTARVWDTATGDPLSDPLPHPDVPLYCEFDSAGTRFLTAGFDGKVRVWSAPEGRLIFETEAHEGWVWEAHFSPDATLIATASRDRTARIFDAETGRILARPIAHARGVQMLRFSPGGEAFVTATEDGSVRIFNARTGEPLSRSMRHRGTVSNVTFSPDGKRLLTGAFDKTARIWNVATGYPLTEPLRHNGDVIRALFMEEGRRLVTTADDGVLRFWETDVFPESVPDWFPAFVEALGGRRFGPDGDLETVPPTKLHELKDRLLTMDSLDPYERWARWFLQERVGQSAAKSEPFARRPDDVPSPPIPN